MSAGRWVKCVKTMLLSMTEIFIGEKYYQVRDFFAPYIIVLIDEFGNSVGFDVSRRDSVFKAHFKLGTSQKRGTEWATRRQQ